MAGAEHLPGGDPHDLVPRERFSAAALGQVLFHALVVRPFLLLFLGLRVSGRQHLPPRDPFILIANHSSHLDTACLLSLFPLRRLHRIRPVAAADFFERNAFLRFFSRTLMNVLTIARSDFNEANDPRRRMLAALESGQSLILFPEGTRGSGAELGHFRGGIATLAQSRPDVPIAPAFMRNLGRALPKGAWIPVPLFCELALGAPLHPGGDRREILGALEDAVRALERSP